MRKRSRLSELLRKTRFDTDTDRKYERSPFDEPKSRVKVVIDLDDEDEGMDDYVRGRRSRRGLDRVSRAFAGPDSGVNASRYDDMVRDKLNKGDDGQRFRVPIIRRDEDDYYPEDEKDDLYLPSRDKSYDRNEFNDEGDVDDIDADAGWKFMRDLEDDEYDDEYDDEKEESKYEGVVRSVQGAYLVSKKRQPDETYTEVWMYNVGKKYADDANIRKNILAGTDIDPTKTFSEDGSQEVVIKTVGNVQFITVVGLPD